VLQTLLRENTGSIRCRPPIPDSPTCLARVPLPAELKITVITFGRLTPTGGDSDPQPAVVGAQTIGSRPAYHQGAGIPVARPARALVGIRSPEATLLLALLLRGPDLLPSLRLIGRDRL